MCLTWFCRKCTVPFSRSTSVRYWTGNPLRRSATDRQFGHGAVNEPLDFSRNDDGKQPLLSRFHRDVDEGNAIGRSVLECSTGQRRGERWPLCPRVALGTPGDDAGLSGLDDELGAQDPAAIGLLVGAVERVLAHGHLTPFAELNVPSRRIDLVGQPSGRVLCGNRGPERPVHRSGGRVELDLPARVLPREPVPERGFTQPGLHVRVGITPRGRQAHLVRID